MTGKLLGYVRVSSVDQNPERQLDGIFVHKKFIDYVSGKIIKRPQLEQLLEFAREDDTIFVHSMDRLARNVKDLRNIIDHLSGRKIKIHFIKENLTFTGDDSPLANLLLMIMGAIAEFEHSCIRERQLEGIALAKKAGKYKGRKKSLTTEKLDLLKEKMLTRDSKTKIAKELGISRFTLYKYLKDLS